MLCTFIIGYQIINYDIWFYDEIPYDGHAKCQRGTTYYSNNPKANDTELDISYSLENLLAYSNTSICWYCVCSVDGHEVGCIPRDSYYCSYYRKLRDPDYTRAYYAEYFEQDRPKYLSSLSFRLRRTMDAGVFSLLDIGGDALCCEHQNGHRRNLHSQMRSKIQQMKLRTPKENILAGSPYGDYVDFIVNND